MANKIEETTLTFLESYEKLKAQAGGEAPVLQGRLPIDRIKFATAVFQPRNIDHAWLASDSHMDSLADAVSNAPDHCLDPLVVWWSGKAWYVIDGHHRLAGYQRALKKDKKLTIESIPVSVFSGSLDEAIRHAASLNSRDKLPMSKEDKLERAWKLVCLDTGWTREDIRDATAVSVRTVANMRAKRLELLADREGSSLLEMTWNETKVGARELSVDNTWKEKLAIDWQKKLVRAFSKKFAENPEIAARALELYSSRLPGMLVREWPDQVKTVLDAEPTFLDEPEF